MTDDRYGSDVLSGFRRQRGPAPVPKVPVEAGLVVETGEGFVGAVVALANGLVELEGRHGRVRSFPLGRGFLVDGAAVELVKPVAAVRRKRTASGSFAVEEHRARTARASRILVEGRHDAELVERVWGDDLRVEGIVVEYLEGVDRLADVLRELQPGPQRRVGVLVDHLVPGSKESRIAAQVGNANVLVVGHPFVDVWQGVKPQRLGMAAWPVIDRGTEWKHGVCEALGWPHADQADIARAWRRMLGRVRGFGDLEPALLGRVEELIDFTSATA